MWTRQDEYDWKDRGRYHSADDYLWRAVRKGDAAEVEQLLSQKRESWDKLNLNCRYEEKTLVYYALAEKNYDVAEILLKHGADVNAPSGFQQFSPLIGACERNDEQAVDLLVKYKCDVNARTHAQETALHRCAWRGHDRLIRRLIEDMGADVNAQDFMKNTALFCAVSSNLPGTIQTLMEMGADTTLVGSDGISKMTALGFAEKFENAARKDVATLLDDPDLKAAGIEKVYEPKTRTAVNIGKPLSFKAKPGSGASFTTFNL